jgi:hypothetical protein
MARIRSSAGGKLPSYGGAQEARLAQVNSQLSVAKRCGGVNEFTLAARER